jgi:hypothetical protein
MMVIIEIRCTHSVWYLTFSNIICWISDKKYLKNPHGIIISSKLNDDIQLNIKKDKTTNNGWQSTTQKQYEQHWELNWSDLGP